jgi:hypothetical protein
MTCITQVASCLNRFLLRCDFTLLMTCAFSSITICELQTLLIPNAGPQYDNDSNPSPLLLSSYSSTGMGVSPRALHARFKKSKCDSNPTIVRLVSPTATCQLLAADRLREHLTTPKASRIV